MKITRITKRIREAEAETDTDAQRLMQEFLRSVVSAARTQFYMSQNIEILPQDIEMPRDERRGAKHASAEILAMLRRGPCMGPHLYMYTLR